MAFLLKTHRVDRETSGRAAPRYKRANYFIAPAFPYVYTDYGLFQSRVSRKGKAVPQLCLQNSFVAYRASLFSRLLFNRVSVETTDGNSQVTVVICEELDRSLRTERQICFSRSLPSSGKRRSDRSLASILGWYTYNTLGRKGFRFHYVYTLHVYRYLVEFSISTTVKKKITRNRFLTDTTRLLL